MRPQHTSQEFEGELRQLKDRLLAMGGRCEALIQRAIFALENADARIAQEVEATDRHIDVDEMDVDELAIRILALRQPVGRDLRFLVTALKVVTDLERIGDEAVNIAERASELAERRDHLPESHAALPAMARASSQMLRDALDAFVEEDADKAQRVLLADDDIDEQYGKILRRTLQEMAAAPARIRSAMSVASCAKYLERIADHATNIAEMVVYLARGEDVRHRTSRRT